MMTPRGKLNKPLLEHKFFKSYIYKNLRWLKKKEGEAKFNTKNKTNYPDYPERTVMHKTIILTSVN